MNTASRKRSLAKSVQRAGFDALLVTHPADIRYLSGFTGSLGALVISCGRAILFVDGRYTEQAKQEATGTRVVIAPRSPLLAACEWVEAAGKRRCGYDPAHTTVAALTAMRAAVSASRRRGLFHATADLVGRQREIKDTEEISCMREAAELGCALFDASLESLSSSLTEVQVALDLEQRARSAGADRMSFDTIVAGGAHSALPHARPTAGAKLPRRGFVTLDFGVVWHGYCSDMTRTVHMGRASSEMRSVYDFVLEAQNAAIGQIAPGVQAGEVDEAARSILRRAKLDTYFTHSTGHGVGLEIHEQPRIGAKQLQRLEPGMIITIEPGVYLEGRFGVRIEDMVLVTAHGCEVLTGSPKALIEL